MRKAARVILPLLAAIGLMATVIYFLWDLGSDPSPKPNQFKLDETLHLKTLGELAVGEKMQSSTSCIVVDVNGYCWAKAYGEQSNNGGAIFTRTKDGFEVMLLEPHTWTRSNKDALAYTKRSLIPVTKMEKNYGD